MHFAVVTLFPEMVQNGMSFGVVGRAMERGLIDLVAVNPRDFTSDVHRTVDDRPYGGGPGMVMKVEPLRAAIGAAREKLPGGCTTVFLSAQGRTLDQKLVRELSELPGLVLVAGRYEGVDERVLEKDIDMEVSVGDYVLSGGEIPALVLMDATVRLLPGVLGDSESATQDSFCDGLLDCPHYTRPEEIDGQSVPEVLLGGNHAEIRRWRLRESLGRTWLRRPDLLDVLDLDDEQQTLLDEFVADYNGDRP